VIIFEIDRIYEIWIVAALNFIFKVIPFRNKYFCISVEIKE
jgi:hypothetical protein